MSKPIKTNVKRINRATPRTIVHKGGIQQNTESGAVDKVEDGNMNPVTSNAVSKAFASCCGYVKTDATDANQCISKLSDICKTYFYSGTFTTNVPVEGAAVIRCYQNYGNIQQYIDYVESDNVTTYKRMITYDGSSSTAWQKVISESELNSALADYQPKGNYLTIKERVGDGARKTLTFTLGTSSSYMLYTNCFYSANAKNGVYAISVTRENDKALINTILDGSCTLTYNTSTKVLTVTSTGIIYGALVSIN